MQIDFHFAGTYSIARLAGFQHNQAATIAYAAQYVDDATNEGEIRFNNAPPFHRIATAHTMVSLGNFENIENIHSWMPFHFLPGNMGGPNGTGSDSSMIRRLICTTDSPVANAMLDACTRDKGKPHDLQRLGITSHVYVDTWVHKDFVGLKNKINSIHGIGSNQSELEDLGDDVASGLTSQLGIGHGAVLSFPDLPFAIWNYTDRDQNMVPRDNPELFMNATKRLFAFYKAYLGDGDNHKILDSDLAVFAYAFTAFTSTKGETRLERWMDLIRRGKFSFGGLTKEERKGLDYTPKGVGSWKNKALGTNALVDFPGRTFQKTTDFDTSDWKYFHIAAMEHRNEVMNRILPDFGLDPSKTVWPK